MEYAKKYLERRIAQLGRLAQNENTRTRIQACNDLIELLEQHPDDFGFRAHREHDALVRLDGGRMDKNTWARISEYVEFISEIER